MSLVISRTRIAYLPPMCQLAVLPPQLCLLVQIVDILLKRLILPFCTVIRGTPCFQNSRLFHAHDFVSDTVTPPSPLFLDQSNLQSATLPPTTPLNDPGEQSNQNDAGDCNRKEEHHGHQVSKHTELQRREVLRRHLCVLI